MVESIQKDYERICHTLTMKNQELESKVEIYESVILNFSNIKDELSDRIEELT